MSQLVQLYYHKLITSLKSKKQVTLRIIDTRVEFKHSFLKKNDSDITFDVVYDDSTIRFTVITNIAGAASYIPCNLRDLFISDSSLQVLLNVL